MRSRTLRLGSVAAITVAAVVSPLILSTGPADAVGAAVRSAAPAQLPFNYTIDIKGFALRGRDMKASSGHFCNRFRSDSPVNPSLNLSINVILVRNRGRWWDKEVRSQTFPIDGSVREYCWPQHDGSETYHFEYRGPVSFQVKGHGTVFIR